MADLSMVVAAKKHVVHVRPEHCYALGHTIHNRLIRE